MSASTSGRLWDLPDPATVGPSVTVRFFDQECEAQKRAKEILAEWVNAWPELFEWQFSSEMITDGLQIVCTRVAMDHRVWTSRDIIPMMDFYEAPRVHEMVAERARTRYKEFCDASAALANERERA